MPQPLVRDAELPLKVTQTLTDVTTPNLWSPAVRELLGWLLVTTKGHEHCCTGR